MSALGTTMRLGGLVRGFLPTAVYSLTLILCGADRPASADSPASGSGSKVAPGAAVSEPTLFLDLTFELGDSAKAAQAVEAVLVLRPSETVRESVVFSPDLDDEESKAEVRRIPVLGSGRIALDLPPGSSWSVNIEAQPRSGNEGGVGGGVRAWWSQPLLVRGPSPERQPGGVVPMRVWPLAYLRVEAFVADPRAGRGSKPVPLDELFLRLESRQGPSKPSRLPPVTVRCRPGAVDPMPRAEKAGSFHCPVPATSLDLAFRPEGLVPVYRWAVGLEAHRTRDLGRIVFVPGGSVSGWVADRASGEPSFENVEVELGPEIDPGAAPAERIQMSKTRRTVRPNSDGFFQFTGVSPGVFRLAARAPSRAPTRSEILAVFEGAETQVRFPLALESFVDLELEVQPPTDAYGEPWSLTLQRRDYDPTVPEDRQAPFRRTADPRPEGSELDVSLFSDVSPEAYGLLVTDSLGNRFGTLPLEIESSGDSEQPIRQSVDLDLVEIEGRIHHGDDGVRARLDFGSRYGPASIRFDSGEGGEFSGFLPREGPWLVEIEGHAPRIWQHRVVDVSAAKAGASRVDIVLPEGKIFGRVVDDAGRPVEGIEVRGYRGSVDRAMTETGSGGEFDLPFLSPGGWVLGASRGRGPTKEVASARVELLEDNSIGPLELALQNWLTYQCQVASVYAFLGGARLVVESIDAQRFGVATMTTDFEGNCQFQMPPGVSTVLATVAAPGHSLTTAVERIGPDRTARFQIEPATGIIEVAVPLFLGEFNDGFELYRDGWKLDRGLLFQWARSQPGQESLALNAAPEEEIRFLIPRVAAGRYELCWVSRLGVESLLRTPVGVPCVSGELAPGGELLLDLARVLPSSP